MVRHNLAEKRLRFTNVFGGLDSITGLAQNCRQRAQCIGMIINEQKPWFRFVTLVRGLRTSGRRTFRSPLLFRERQLKRENCAVTGACTLRGQPAMVGLGDSAGDR